MTDEQRKLVEDNMKLVTYCLKRYFRMPKGACRDDYQQEGYLGLCIAAKRFNPDLGYKFSTYALPMILGVMNKYKRDYFNDHAMIRLPRSAKDKLNNMVKDGVDITQTEFGNILNIISLDYHMEDSEKNLHEIIRDTKYGVDEDSIEFLEFRDLLYTCVDKVLDEYSMSGHYCMLQEYIYSLIYGDEKLGQGYLANKYDTTQPTVARTIVKFSGRILEIVKDSM